MKLEDAIFAIEVLAENGFSVVYFTGGEPGLYPHLVDAVNYAKKRGMITSITTNGTISETILKKMSKSLDVLSVSVDHYNERIWDEAKHIVGISRKAKETIRTAKTLGTDLYGITFLNPNWSVQDVERVIRYVNEELGISFAISYPYVSSNNSTFVVGGAMRGPLSQAQLNIRNMVAKVLEMKLLGSDVATVSGYLRDVLRAYDGLPMRYPCTVGETVMTVDCNLNVFPCYKRERLCNLRERQDLNGFALNNSLCDNKSCLINCFKEASLASKESCLKAVKEEFFSNPRFYLKLAL